MPRSNTRATRAVDVNYREVQDEAERDDSDYRDSEDESDEANASNDESDDSESNDAKDAKDPNMKSESVWVFGRWVQVPNIKVWDDITFEAWLRTSPRWDRVLKVLFHDKLLLVDDMLMCWKAFMWKHSRPFCGVIDWHIDRQLTVLRVRQKVDANTVHITDKNRVHVDFHRLNTPLGEFNYRLTIMMKLVQLGILTADAHALTGIRDVWFDTMHLRTGGVRFRKRNAPTLASRFFDAEHHRMLTCYDAATYLPPALSTRAGIDAPRMFMNCTVIDESVTHSCTHSYMFLRDMGKECNIAYDQPVMICSVESTSQKFWHSLLCDREPVLLDEVEWGSITPCPLLQFDANDLCTLHDQPLKLFNPLQYAIFCDALDRVVSAFPPVSDDRLRWMCVQEGWLFKRHRVGDKTAASAWDLLHCLPCEDRLKKIIEPFGTRFGPKNPRLYTYDRARFEELQLLKKSHVLMHLGRDIIDRIIWMCFDP